MDTFTVDTVLLKRLCALVVIEVTTRRVHVLGVTPASGRGVGDAAGAEPAHGGPRSRRRSPVLIRDRDTKFTGAFDAVFAAEAIQVLTMPVQAPRAHAYAER